MKIKRLILTLVMIPAAITAMSFAPVTRLSSNTITSNILENGTVNAKKQLASSYINKKSLSITEVSVGKKEILADISLNYEIYSMDKYTVLLTKYVPMYSLVYKIDVRLYADVSYKGGFLDMWTYTKNAFLNHIFVNAQFDNYNKSSENYKTTVYPDSVSNNGTRCLANLDVNPTDASDIEGRDNAAYDTLRGQTCSSIKTTSYYWSDLDSNPDTKRLATYCTSVISKSGSKLKYVTKYIYSTDGMGYDSNILELGNGTLTEESSCGPSGHDDYVFSIYGACNFESDTAPKQCVLTLETMTRLGDMNYMGYDNYSSKVSTTIALA